MLANKYIIYKNNTLYIHKHNRLVLYLITYILKET